jgi:MFS family permease
MTTAASQQAMLTLLDLAPMRGAQYRLFLLSTGGTLLNGFSLVVLGVALPLIIDQFAIGPGMVGLIGAAIVLGAVVGSAAGGPAADRFGRRPAYLVDMLVVAAGGALSAVAADPTTVLIGQFVVGFGVGIDFPVSGAYVAEFMPKSARGRMIVATIAFQSVGMLVAAAVAMAGLTALDQLGAWRAFFAVEAALAGIVFLCRLSLPESARWYMSRGRNAEAAQAIARILPSDRTKLEQLAAAAGPAVHNVSKLPQQSQPLGIGALFSAAYRTRTILVSVPWFLMDVATYGVGLFTPIILGGMALSGRLGGPVANDFADTRGTGAIDLFLLIGSLLSLWVVPRFGRMGMQNLGFVGMTVGMLILLFATLQQGGPARHAPLVLVGFILFNLLMNLGPNATTFTMPPELFPTQMRASASGFAGSVAKLGATVGIFFCRP